MDKNLAYRSLYLHFTKGLDLTEVSTETGLNERVIKAIVSGVREPDVVSDYYEDRKAGDFTRVYPEPNYKKLSKLDYAVVLNRYVSIVCAEIVTVSDIQSYLIEDEIEPKQAEKMLKAVENVYKDKQRKLLGKKLEAILDVLAMPSKWELTDTGLRTVYYIPVLDEKYNVIGTELKPTQSFSFPDELWSRYVGK